MDRTAVAAMIAAYLQSNPEHFVIDIRRGDHTLAHIDVPAAGPANLANDCQRDIWLTLQDVGHRLTTTALLAELDKRGRKWAESWVRECLVAMMDTGLIDNQQRTNPKGYGFPAW